MKVEIRTIAIPAEKEANTRVRTEELEDVIVAMTELMTVGLCFNSNDVSQKSHLIPKSG